MPQKNQENPDYSLFSSLLLNLLRGSALAFAVLHAYQSTTTMTTMRKVVITEFGDVDVLKIVETTCPPPAPGFVQIATEYSGSTGGDISMRKSIYPDQDPAPLTPGYSLVGKPQALGEGCTTIKKR